MVTTSIFKSFIRKLILSNNRLVFSPKNDTQVSLALHNYHLYFKETSRTQVKEKLKASLCLRNKRFRSSYGVKIWSQSPSPFFYLFALVPAFAH